MDFNTIVQEDIFLLEEKIHEINDSETEYYLTESYNDLNTIGQLQIIAESYVSIPNAFEIDILGKNSIEEVMSQLTIQNDYHGYMQEFA